MVLLSVLTEFPSSISKRSDNNMSKYCIIKSCKARAAFTVITGEKITIHKFPQNETLRQQWDSFVNFANHSTNFKSKSHLICSRHFDPSCYKSGRITSNAVPSIKDESMAADAFQQLIPDFSSQDLNAPNGVFCPVVHSFGNTSPDPTSNESTDFNDTCDFINDNVIPVEVVITEAQYNTVPTSSENNSMDFNDEKMIYVENGCIGEDPLRDVSMKDENVTDDPDCTSTLSSTYIATVASTCQRERNGCIGEDPLKDVSVKDENVTDDPDCTSTLSSTYIATVASTCQRESSPKNSGEKTFKRQKRSGECPDLSPSDFSSPQRRNANLKRLKDELSISKKHVRIVNQRLSRAEKKIETLKLLIDRRVQMLLKQSSAHSKRVSTAEPLRNPNQAAPS